MYHWPMPIGGPALDLGFSVVCMQPWSNRDHVATVSRRIFRNYDRYMAQFNTFNKNTRLSDSYDVHGVPLQPRPVCYTAPKQPYPQK